MWRLGLSCEGEPGPEGGDGQHEDESVRARKGVLPHEAGDREAGTGQGWGWILYVGEHVQEVGIPDEISNVQHPGRVSQQSKQSREGRGPAWEAQVKPILRSVSDNRILSFVVSISFSVVPP